MAHPFVLRDIARNLQLLRDESQYDRFRLLLHIQDRFEVGLGSIQLGLLVLADGAVFGEQILDLPGGRAVIQRRLQRLLVRVGLRSGSAARATAGSAAASTTSTAESAAHSAATKHAADSAASAYPLKDGHFNGCNAGIRRR